MRKPGMAKYAAFRGPHPGEPIEKHLAFWTRDAQRASRDLAEAEEAQDGRLIKLATKHLREANTALQAWGAKAKMAGALTSLAATAAAAESKIVTLRQMMETQKSL